MPVQIKMPALSSTQDEGKLAKWFVNEGQRVRAGDVIAEVETDEALIDIEAVEEGVIAKLLVPAGTAAVKVNTPIAVLEQGAGGGVRQGGPAPRLAAGDPGQRLGSVPVEPTVIVRTRFKGTKISTGQSTAGGQSAAGGPSPTLAAGARPATGVSSPKTTLVRPGNAPSDPVAGWLVVVKGPGRGGYRPVYMGMNAMGRDANQRISLSFGDDMISREEHAFITYDEELRKFYVQHGGKSNLVRIGKDPVLVPTELKGNDMIRIGKTTLLFIPFCGADFSWGDEEAMQ